jgi:hypothetical protein
MTAKWLLAVAACCIAFSHVAWSEEPEGAARLYLYFADAQAQAAANCVSLLGKKDSGGGFSHASAAADAKLSGRCPGGLAPQQDDALDTVDFNPAEMFVDASSSGGNFVLATVSLGTTVFLRGPATATKVTVVEEFTGTGSITLSGGGRPRPTTPASRLPPRQGRRSARTAAPTSSASPGRLVRPGP